MHPHEPGHQHRIRHLHVESGHLTLDYKATADHANDIATALSTGLPGTIVTVDDDLRDNLPSLPCGELWQ